MKTASNSATLDERALDELDGDKLLSLHADAALEAEEGTPGAAARRDAIEAELERRTRESKRLDAIATARTRRSKREEQQRERATRVAARKPYDVERTLQLDDLDALDRIVDNHLVPVLDRLVKRDKVLYGLYATATGKAQHHMLKRLTLFRLLLARLMRRYGLDNVSAMSNHELSFLRDPDDSTRILPFQTLLTPPPLPKEEE